MLSIHKQAGILSNMNIVIDNSRWLYYFNLKRDLKDSFLKDGYQKIHVHS